MRSVTFADARVVDLLNAKFVVAWNNHNPDLDGGAGARQPRFTAEELELYPEGGGGGNVRAIVCLPDGRIVHYVMGWFRPERLVEELEFALTLDEKDAREKHDAHAREHAEAQATLAKDHPREMTRDFAQSAIRRRHAMLGLQAQTHAVAAGVLLQAVDKHLDEVKRHSSSRAFK